MISKWYQVRQPETDRAIVVLMIRMALAVPADHGVFGNPAARRKQALAGIVKPRRT
jgi:hypothetical protein